MKCLQGKLELLRNFLLSSRCHNLTESYALDRYPPFYDENPFGIYQKILTGKVDYPKHIDGKAKDLIKKLLTHDRTKRLGNAPRYDHLFNLLEQELKCVAMLIYAGCLRNGAEDVKKHKYFSKVDWNSVMNKKDIPPYLPPIQGPGDHTNFDQYPESTEDTAIALVGDDQAAFDAFNSF